MIAQKNPKAKESIEKTNQQIKELQTKKNLHTTEDILKKSAQSFYGI